MYSFLSNGGQRNVVCVCLQKEHSDELEAPFFSSVCGDVGLISTAAVMELRMQLEESWLSANLLKDLLKCTLRQLYE